MYIKYTFPKKDHLNSVAHYTRKRETIVLFCLHMWMFCRTSKGFGTERGFASGWAQPTPHFWKDSLID